MLLTKIIKCIINHVNNRILDKLSNTLGMVLKYSKVKSIQDTEKVKLQEMFRLLS